MIAFEVSVNGKHLCLAGIEGDGVLHVSVVHSRRVGKEVPPFWVHVGGLANNEHLRWITGDGRRKLKVGDTLEIKVVETQVVEPPKERFPARRDD